MYDSRVKGELVDKGMEMYLPMWRASDDNCGGWHYLMGRNNMWKGFLSEGWCVCVNENQRVGVSLSV